MLSGVVGRLDSDLAKQVRRAASSVALNIAEAWGRKGGSRAYHFRVAYASCLELHTALEVARRWGSLKDAQVDPISDLVARTAACLRRSAGF